MIRGTKLSAWFVLATLAGAFVAGASAAEPIEIVAVAPANRIPTRVAVSMMAGIEEAADRVNRAGGVLGRKLAIVETAEAREDATAAQLGQELAARRPVAVIGIISTHTALTVAPYMEDARIPLIVTVASGSGMTSLLAPPEYRENYVFHLAPTATIEAKMLAGYIRRRGIEKIAVLANASPAGENERRDLLAVLTLLGTEVTKVEKFNLGDTTMKQQLGRARSAGAEIILAYGGAGRELAQIALDRAALGWPVPLIGSAALSAPNFIDRAGPAAEGAVMSQTFFEKADTPAGAAFIAALRARTGAERIASPATPAQGYDAILLLAAAITQAGSTEGPDIRETLEHLAHPVIGLIKTYDRPFSPKNHEAMQLSDVALGIVKNGRVIRLEAP